MARLSFQKKQKANKTRPFNLQQGLGTQNITSPEAEVLVPYLWDATEKKSPTLNTQTPFQRKCSLRGVHSFIFQFVLMQFRILISMYKLLNLKLYLYRYCLLLQLSAENWPGTLKSRRSSRRILLATLRNHSRRALPCPPKSFTNYPPFKVRTVVTWIPLHGLSSLHTAVKYENLSNGQGKARRTLKQVF